MATKKSSTSKTARVMNLLSKSREEAPVAEEVAAAVPSTEESAPAVAPAPASETPAPAPVHTAPTPPIITAMQADSAISNQVMSALESALDSELGAAAPQAAPTVEDAPEVTPDVPAEEAAPVEEHAAVTEEAAPAEEGAPVEEPTAETAPTEDQAAPTEESIPTDVAPAANDADDDFDPDHEPSPPTQFKVDRHSTYVNVMETLVEEKASKYIDLFGLCKCHRCVADVKAYALNHLTPKYVVMLTGEVIPRISVYEGQFAADVTAQILTACKVVMASPRHDLPQ